MAAPGPAAASFGTHALSILQEAVSNGIDTPAGLDHASAGARSSSQVLAPSRAAVRTTPR
jgi:hypothetical protein